MTDDTEQRPESLLPYDEWTDEAMRHVMLRALNYAATNGLPGGHHFYLTFRTDMAGVIVPDRLREQYPHEMTIVVQHQFWDLKADDATRVINVGLSFGGIPTTLSIPYGSVTQFVDPYVRYGLRFNPLGPDGSAAPEAPADAAPALAFAAKPDAPEAAADADATGSGEDAQVVSLDAFRRRPPNRES